MRLRKLSTSRRPRSLCAGIRKKGLRYFNRYVQPAAFLLPINVLEDFIFGNHFFGTAKKTEKKKIKKNEKNEKNLEKSKNKEKNQGYSSLLKKIKIDKKKKFGKLKSKECPKNVNYTK